MDAEEFYMVQEFGWVNYTVFGLMLGMTAAIGIYVGCFGKVQRTAEEYILGGRAISFLLVGISLVTSHVSAVTLIGVPAEVYLYGTLYWLICPSIIVVGFITIRVFVPVYEALKITTLPQYLEMRFNKGVRMMGTILYTLNTALFLPILIYGPSLAFSQVSGINLHIITTAMCSICTFYTMMGGLKGIIWTDGLQAFIIVGSGLAWVIMGTLNAGGIANVWRRAKEGDRLRLFEMDPSPFESRTFWTLTLGSIGLWTYNTATNPLMVQRYLAVSSPRKTKTSIILYCLGMIFVNSMSCYTGLIIYSLYADCDPVENGVIEKHDQLMPYFIMDTVGRIPGLPGLFIAAVFSGALSSLSSAMNALCAVMYEEFVMKLISTPAKFSPHTYMKLEVVIIGIFCSLMTFVVDKLGELVQVTLSINGITSGTLLGLYTLGMICPWATSKGSIAGTITSLILLLCVGCGALLSRLRTVPTKFVLSTSNHGCMDLTNATIYATNATTVLGDAAKEGEIFFLFRISFAYYSLLGALTVIVVGTIISFATRPNELRGMDPNLIAPDFQFLLSSRPKDSTTTVTLLVTGGTEEDNCDRTTSTNTH